MSSINENSPITDGGNDVEKTRRTERQTTSENQPEADKTATLPLVPLAGNSLSISVRIIVGDCADGDYLEIFSKLFWEETVRKDKDTFETYFVTSNVYASMNKYLNYVNQKLTNLNLIRCCSVEPLI